ncbi:Proline iminopeptidase [Pseudohongiella spirulinae]|uniref:Proline iminopeptidase n=2 Tax=Pseudohongiella spirulinae TaxID=1249552 RepID=A0A0S2KGH8_9GAMM|nr:Proline iminopeptidase [Pseudohongiella spirulinae]
MHSLYVERCGNKNGHPVIFLHGGPGSQVNANHRRYFDPDFYDSVLFDQRGCGQSAPAGETRENTTQDLINDINTLRSVLDINGPMTLFGGSWGSTLALAYAQQFPQNVQAMILRGIFLGTDDEVSWFTGGLKRFAPRAWQNMSEGMGQDLIEAYYQAVFDTNQSRATEAALRWVEYEMQIMKIGSDADGVSSLPESETILNRARIHLHFIRHKFFLGDTDLLNSSELLQIPVTIVQGEIDLVCPPITAWQLSQRLPDARLRLLGNAGHSGMADVMACALREEADALRDRLLIKN